MLILFDHVTPRGVAGSLTSHTVTTARDRGWDKLTNGDLLAEAGRLHGWTVAGKPPKCPSLPAD
jgi:phage protein D